MVALSRAPRRRAPHVREEAAVNTAVDLIRAEHRHMLRVVTGLEVLAERIRRSVPLLACDAYDMLGEIGDYLRIVFGERHHAHEEAFLFDLMRRRDPASRDMIDKLVDEHRMSARMSEDLCERARALADGHDRDFLEAARAFSRFERRHMMSEESGILMRARDLLDEDDWARVAAGYAATTGEGGDGLRMRPEFVDLTEKIIALSLFGDQVEFSAGRSSIEPVFDHGSGDGRGRGYPRPLR